jgi:tetratricopeptide (TPR) repeat protein
VSSREGRATAFSEAEKALEIFERLRDTVGAGHARNNLAYSAYMIGNWDACEEYHLANREALRDSGDVLGLALNGLNLGELYLEQGRYEEAAPLLERALATFRGARHSVGESASRLTLGRLWTRMGRTSDARAQFDRAVEIATEAEAGDQVVETALGRIEMALTQGDISAAEQFLNELDSTLAGTSGVRCSMFEGAVRFARGDEDTALAMLDEARSAASEVGAKHLEFEVDEMRARLFGSGVPETDQLGSQLGMLARPVYRLSRIGSETLTRG